MWLKVLAPVNEESGYHANVVCAYTSASDQRLVWITCSPTCRLSRAKAHDCSTSQQSRFRTESPQMELLMTKATRLLPESLSLVTWRRRWPIGQWSSSRPYSSVLHSLVVAASRAFCATSWALREHRMSQPAANAVANLLSKVARYSVLLGIGGSALQASLYTGASSCLGCTRACSLQQSVALLQG